jgi:hypothetical protein
MGAPRLRVLVLVLLALAGIGCLRLPPASTPAAGDAPAAEHDGHQQQRRQR